MFSFGEKAKILYLRKKKKKKKNFVDLNLTLVKIFIAKGTLLN